MCGAGFQGPITDPTTGLYCNRICPDDCNRSPNSSSRHLLRWFLTDLCSPGAGKSLSADVLKTFISVAKTKSFTKAAEQTFCTQSTASLRIQELEKFYGIKLFDRIGKKVYLTEAGRNLLPYIELILNTFQESKDRVQQMKNLSYGKVFIVASHTPGTYILPEVIKNFKEMYQNIKINCHIEYSKNVIKNIKNDNYYDIAVLSQPHIIKEDDLKCEEFSDDKIVLVVSPNHKWVQKGIIDIKEIKNENLLLSNVSTTLINFLNKFLDEDLDKESLIIMGNLEAVKRGVVYNLGIAFLSYFAVKDDLKKGKLKEIRLKNLNLKRKILLLYKKKKVLSPAAIEFINFFKDYLKKL